MNIGPSYYRALDRWQSPEAAADYRRKRDPSRYRRYAREEAIINGWLDGLPSAALILDIPCGTGRLVRTVRERGFNYLGADVSRSMIEEARRLTRSPQVHGFVHADAARLPLAENSVECVIIWRLLHHIRSSEIRRRVLREAARVARTRVIVSFHQRLSITFLRKFIRRRLRGKPPGAEITHWRLRRESLESGLRLVATRGRFGSLNWSACLSKGDPAC